MVQKSFWKKWFENYTTMCFTGTHHRGNYGRQESGKKQSWNLSSGACYFKAVEIGTPAETVLEPLHAIHAIFKN